MKLIRTEEKFVAKWIAVKQTTYLDKNNNEQKWDFVTRTTAKQVVTIICHAKQSRKILLISQPRIPVNKIVIEFPAGLVDAGEELGQAGLRELKEETGFDGNVLSVYPSVSKSAGLTDEATGVIEVEVDENAVRESSMEETEDIKSFWISPQEFNEMLKKIDNAATIVDTQVWFYFKGLSSGVTQVRAKPVKTTKKSMKRQK
jgi:8-oxo-dGTP pyrophosphatase MutT (NUDIX family)